MSDFVLTPTPTVELESFLAEFSGSVLGSVEELQDYLDVLADAVRRHVPGCDAVGVTLLNEDLPSTATYTTVHTLEVDAIQYRLDEGPCLEAYRTGVEVAVDLDTAAERWPRFAAAVEGEQVRSLVALPLATGGDTVGALNLYAFAADAFLDADMAQLRIVASRAADTIAAAIRLLGVQELAGQLERALVSRVVIEQAKGVLMGRHGLTETAAFEALRVQSQRTNVKLRELATEVVRGATGPEDASAPTGSAAGE